MFSSSTNKNILISMLHKSSNVLARFVFFTYFFNCFSKMPRPFKRSKCIPKSRVTGSFNTFSCKNCAIPVSVYGQVFVFDAVS